MSCTEIMKLLIYYDDLMNMYFCWPVLYYLLLWCCIVMTLCIACGHTSLLHYKAYYGSLPSRSYGQGNSTGWKDFM